MKLTAVDLSFGIIGDFKVSKSGDIEDTSKDKYQSLRQEIRTRLMGSTGDWGINYPIHTNLRRFIGQEIQRCIQLLFIRIIAWFIGQKITYLN